jgi:NitT/TauT family transport system substrate-binding protein
MGVVLGARGNHGRSLVPQSLSQTVVKALRRRRLLAGLGWLLAALAAGSCSRPPLELTLPVSNWPGYEYFYLAEQKDLAVAEGLNLRTAEFPDPQAIVHAFLRGELQVAQLTTVEAVDICSRAPDRCPVVVLVLDESRGGDQVAARPGIPSLAELRGRRVGLTLSTLGPYVLSRALEREGLSLDDVQLRNVPLEAMVDALAKGMVDAVAFFPPYSELAYRAGVARKLFDSGAIPGEIFDVLVVSPEFYAAHGESLVRLLRTWQAAHDLARAEPAMARALMARREGLTLAEFSTAEEGLVYRPLRDQVAMLAPGGLLERNLLAVQAVQKALKLVTPGSALPKVSQAPVQAALR